MCPNFKTKKATDGMNDVGLASTSAISPAGATPTAP